MSSTPLGISGKEFDALLKNGGGYAEFYQVPEGCEQYSIFFSEVRPVYCYSLEWVELSTTGTQSGGSTVTYTLSQIFDKMMYIFSSAKIPAMRMKEEYADNYEFCFTNNISQVMIDSGVMKIDGQEIQKIDMNYMMCDDGYLRKPGFDETYDECAGNISDLIEFSTSHDSHEINPLHPYFMARHSSQSFPIYRLPSDSVITFTYTFKRELFKLIRLRQRQADGGYRYLQVNHSDLARMIDGYPSDGLIENPSIHACVARITEKELEVLQKDHPEIDYHIENVTSYIDNADKNYGQIASCQPKLTYPCKAIYILTENVTSSNLNNRTNYSTDVHDLIKGGHPIEYVELKFGDDSKLKLPPTFITGPLAIIHSSSSPKRRGIYSLPFSYLVPSHGIEMGQLLNNLNPTLSVKFIDPAGSIFDAPVPGQTATIFKMHVRCLGIRKISFGWKTPFKLSA